MHHHLQFAAAMKKWEALSAPHQSTSAASSGHTSTATTSTSCSAPRQSAPTMQSERLRIAPWPSTRTEENDDVPDEVRALREAVQQQTASSLGQEVALSTLVSYQQVLDSTITAAEAALQRSLLPLRSEDDVLDLFSFLKVQDGEKLHWSKVRSLRSAFAKYHDRLSLPSPFDDWSPRLRAYWRGLAKDCVHTGSGKVPVAFEALMDYLQIPQDTNTSDALVRNAAMVVGLFRNSPRRRSGCPARGRYHRAH